jgi:DNA-binding MarR family transcriptional regulator
VSVLRDPDLTRRGNSFGALALVVADRLTDAAVAAGGQSPSTAAALSALRHFLDRPTIDRLRQVLGLTSSGAVRLVDRLETAGYVTRGPGPDARSVTVALTPAGHRVADRVTAARHAVLENALSVLTPADRADLERITTTMFAAFVRGPGATRWICRLCDTTACDRGGGRCPAANVAASRLPPRPVRDLADR